METGDEVETPAALSFRTTGAAGATPASAPLVKDETDVNLTSRALNLKFWVSSFYIIKEKEPYFVLKELVVKETVLPDYQRREKLHALPVLGDQRPSELLASIRNLQPVADCKCYFARYQFLSRMPPITRAQLVNQKDLTVDELAALAAVPGEPPQPDGRGERQMPQRRSLHCKPVNTASFSSELCQE